MAEPREKLQDWTDDVEVLRELIRRGAESGPGKPIDFDEVRRKGRELAARMKGER